MQRAGNDLAEDCCLKKHHSQNADTRAEDAAKAGSDIDIEKRAVRRLDRTFSTRTITRTDASGQCHETGVLEEDLPSDSAASNPPDHDEKDDFPEGGLRAWLVVAGAFCGSFSVFGIINSTAILLEWFSSHQLQDKNASQVRMLNVASEGQWLTRSLDRMDLRVLPVPDILLWSSHWAHL